MTSLLSMLDRFEQAAVTYETSEDRADRDELHAARRAILEAFEALTRDRDHWHAYSSGQGKLIESGVFVKNEEYVALVERIAALIAERDNYATIAESKVVSFRGEATVRAETAEASLSAAQSEIAELKAALDSDPDGKGLWRFWANKASELTATIPALDAKNERLVEREAELVALLSSARNELEYQHGSFEPGDIRCACCRLMRSIDRALHPKPKSEG